MLKARWKEDDDRFLTYMYGKNKNKELAKMLNRSINAIKARAYFLKLTSPQKETLCWSCKRACGKDMCSWAREFKPISGWAAEKTIILEEGEETVNSYRVEICPEYIFDEREKRKDKNGK